MRIIVLLLVVLVLSFEPPTLRPIRDTARASETDIGLLEDNLVRVGNLSRLVLSELRDGFGEDKTYMIFSNCSSAECDPEGTGVAEAGRHETVLDSGRGTPTEAAPIYCPTARW